jgi:type II secretory pathway pseudopilin PulG
MTVFELTIVLLIALILLALAYVMTRPAMLNTKVSRVQEDHRAIARALSNYLIDHGAAPPALRFLQGTNQYMTYAPRDPFQGSAGSYLYISSPSPELPSLLISPGPDGMFNVPVELLRFADSSMLAPSFRNQLSSGPGAAAMRLAGRSREEARFVTDSDLAILSTYLYLGAYDRTKGSGGDIITLVH